MTSLKLPHSQPSFDKSKPPHVDVIMHFVYSKYPPDNMIVNAISYLFSTTNTIEQNIFHIKDIVLSQCSPGHTVDSTVYTVIATASVLFYTSMRLMYDLPHMRNKFLYKSKPCLHVTYGEIVTQLTSICLTGLAVEMLNETIKDHSLKMKIFDSINSNVAETKLTAVMKASGPDQLKAVLSDQLQEAEHTLYEKTLETFCHTWGFQTSASETKVKKLILSLKKHCQLVRTHT